MQNKRNQTKQPRGKAKAPVNKEAFKMLAMEIGLNEASRRMNIPIPTGKSWARRGGWKLPERPGGRPQRTIAASSMHPVADALDASHGQLGNITKSALAQAIAKAAQSAAKKQALPLDSIAQLRDACLTAAKIFGWDGSAHPSVTVNADKAVVVCDEAMRQKLIAQRERLLQEQHEKRVA